MLAKLCFQAQSFLNRTRVVFQAECPSLDAEFLEGVVPSLCMTPSRASSRLIQASINLITLCNHCNVIVRVGIYASNETMLSSLWA